MILADALVLPLGLAAVAGEVCGLAWLGSVPAVRELLDRRPGAVALVALVAAVALVARVEAM